ncbi:MAG TPA: YceI family protein [Ilumatobacteraceae bacterium]|nr:YceI family protein [Ilumatobacteraceae bacterium]
MKQHWKKIALGLAAVVLLGIGGFYAYVLWIKDDAPPALTSEDLDDALTTTTPSSDATAPLSSDPPSTDGTTTDPAGVDGVWIAVQDGSTVGYRIQEVLAGVDKEAAGRTDQVTGSITIAGTQVTGGDFTVDMTSITSDESRRDGQFRGRIMSVDQFPTATFVLTAPIEFGTIPADGESITATATGDLTLRGVTRSVTFEVEAQLEGDRIGVLGNIPITFDDYEIPEPSNAIATVQDDGLLEFIIVFERT